MSTKIFNGYYVEKCSLEQLHQKMLEMNGRFQKVLFKSYATTFAIMATAIIDEVQFGLPVASFYKETHGNGTIVPFIACFMALQGLHGKIVGTKRRNPAFDFSMNISLIPTKSKILALLYTDRAEFQRVWEKTPGVHKYPYWNNTDKPSNLSQKVWDARGDEWDKALGERGIPALVGFTWDPLADNFPFLDKTKIMKFIPSNDIRAKLITEELFEKEWNSSQPKVASKDFYEMWDKYREWKRSEAGVKRLAELDSEVRSKLIPITEKALFETYKDVTYHKV